MDAAIGTIQPVERASQLLADAAAGLVAAGVQTSRLDAEVLLAAACGIDRSALYARLRDAVPPQCRDDFRSMLARRIAREPLQYIVGRQEFWSLDFDVTPQVLIPRPETELLVELAVAALCRSNVSFDGAQDVLREPQHERFKKYFILDDKQFSVRPEEPPFSGGVSKGSSGGNRHAPQGEGKGRAARRLTLCDLGTGSGCIAVALARELPGAEICALDSSQSALTVAATNARRHGVAERIRFVESDLFAAVGGQRFDAIVANPPYVSASDLRCAQPELGWEPRQALDGGVTGLDVIQPLVSAAPDFLVEGGWLVMEIGADQALVVQALAEAAGFNAVSVRPDYAGLPRVLLARQ
jgi:release factor glutamine methyltransferase